MSAQYSWGVFVPTVILVLVGLAPGCGAPESRTPPTPTETPTGSIPVQAEADRIYERQIAFFEVNPEGDALTVGWWFRTETTERSPRREVIGWLGRGSNWDPFFSDAWITNPDPAPWRLHPRDPMRLQIGDGDELESILYRSEGRYLDLQIGTSVVSWREARGGTIRLSEATVVLQDRTTPGLLLDLQRARGVDEGSSSAWTEWFLLVGDGVRIVLVADQPALWQGWILDDQGDRLLPALGSQWTGRRVVNNARREIPTGWVLSGPRGEIWAELEAVSSHLESLDGPGPVFPVEGLQAIEGIWVMGTDTIHVRGLQRLSHR